jgi:hypothetical protein
VDNIFFAKAADYQAATITLLPGSDVELPAVSGN